jgi:hypothetical protein
VPKSVGISIRASTKEIKKRINCWVIEAENIQNVPEIAAFSRFSVFFNCSFL